MHFRCCFLVLLFLFINCDLSSQNDYLISFEKDTLYGEIEIERRLFGGKVNIDTDNGALSMRFREVFRYSINDSIVTRIELARPFRPGGNLFTPLAYRPITESGDVKLYSVQNEPLFVKQEFLFKRHQMKYFMNDMEFERENIFSRNKGLAHYEELVARYNAFKAGNPSTKSFTEKWFFDKPTVTPQINYRQDWTFFPNSGKSVLRHETDLEFEFRLLKFVSAYSGTRVTFLHEIGPKEVRILRNPGLYNYALLGLRVYPFHWLMQRNHVPHLGLNGFQINLRIDHHLPYISTARAYNHAIAAIEYRSTFLCGLQLTSGLGVENFFDTTYNRIRPAGNEILFLSYFKIGYAFRKKK